MCTTMVEKERELSDDVFIGEKFKDSNLFEPTELSHPHLDYNHYNFVPDIASNEKSGCR